ncbi:MAG TPA: efflux RND transporter permease subunit [Burkholderiales bacterium]|nr:efflux RND transporter permease subunit [Burkholderiales bacterium]
MKFTDIFIKRPVLATVISLLILVLGLRSLNLLPVTQYPKTENAVITVTTIYTGASPDLVAGFITTPLENAIAQANGIDYLQSSSTQGLSTITANLRLNYDANKAMTEISAQVNSVLNQLPPDALKPTIKLSIGQTTDAMYMAFYSDTLPSNKVTDYLLRVVQPKLSTVDGVQQAEILGGRQFAMRIWLEPDKMAAYGVSAAQVRQVLAANDFISAVGRTEGQMVTVDLIASTGVHSADEFRKLIVKSQNGAIVRLGDIAHITLGAEDYNTSVVFDGLHAVFIGIKVAPAANLLTVIDRVRHVFPQIQSQLPQGLQAKIVYDSTDYINSSIHEVLQTLIEALVIVTIVIFLFLGSIRSTLIPIIAMPLSLIGAFLFMLVLGYSINLLTLLALVLAIGLVVDDAIIVVENVHRHMELGSSPFEAALAGARELGSPIIAMTIVLIAVYLPIGFMGGLTGALFTEFAFTLVAAVVVSAIMALTLSPMMCSKFLKHNGGKQRLVHFLDRLFERVRLRYVHVLKGVLDYRLVTAVFALIVLVSIYFLYATSKKELAPDEDQGVVLINGTAAPNATLQQTELYSNEIIDIYKKLPEHAHLFMINGYQGLNTVIAGIVLKPWDQRSRTQMQVQPIIQKELNDVTGLKAAAFPFPPLPGARGFPVQFVLGTTEPFLRLYDVSQELVKRAEASGMFFFVDNDLKYDKPQTTIVIDRNKAADLGLTMSDIGQDLGAMLGGGYVNFFSISGRSYKVIPQVQQRHRLNAAQLENYYIRTGSGAMVPLSTVASLKTTVVPETLNHFQQLNSATISAVTRPGITTGQALTWLGQQAKEVMPPGYTIDYAGQSRQYVQESSALLVTFFFSIIIIFLVLAALFESFRDPLIVLISVPMSICGAMIFISLGLSSLNIYTEVGLVTLIGLISKHGILIVQFANDLQRAGKAKREAIEEAAGIRLRPILMTTAAMVLGVLPLITASGAGAVGRFDMGLVIATGIGIGTLFTLFVVPTMYLFLAEEIEPEGGAETEPVTA